MPSATAVHLEVLNRVPFLGVGVVEGVGEAGAVHRFLVDTVDDGRLRQADDLEDRGHDVDAVGELGAEAAAGDPVRPGDDHRVAGAAEVAGHLLAPLKGGVVRVRPGGGEVRGCVEAAELFDAAVLVDHRELLLGVEYDAVEERGLVERAGQRALHRGTVVAPDVDDESVVELAHLVHGVEHPADVPVGVLREPGEHLHLPGIQLPLGIGQTIPRRVRRWPLGELGVRRDDTERLLPLESLFAVDVPPVVELALVLVRPCLGHVVGRMCRAGGVVDEPRLLSVLRTDGVEPLDRLVGDVVGEVVQLLVLTLGYTEGRVVLGDDRVILARGTGQEAPPVVEAPPGGPVVERARSTHVATRRHVPLAEPAGDVPVLLENAGQRGAGSRPHTGIARERPRELRDAAHPHPVVVTAGQHRGARGRADRGDVEPVVGDALLLHACEIWRSDAAAERVGPTEAGVVDEHDQDVRRVIGRLRRRHDAPVAHRLIDRESADPAEGPIGDREHGAVGVELAHSLGQLLLQLVDAVLVALHDRLQRRSRKRPLHGEPGLGWEDTDHHSRAGLERGTDLLLDGSGELVAGEVTHHGTCGRTHGHGTEHGRRK